MNREQYQQKMLACLSRPSPKKLVKKLLLPLLAAPREKLLMRQNLA